MAFFGLTQLGFQNSIRDNMRGGTQLQGKTFIIIILFTRIILIITILLKVGVMGRKLKEHYMTIMRVLPRTIPEVFGQG